MIELRILGAPHLQRAEGDATHSVPLQPKLLALLGYLNLTEPAGFGRRDTLLALFWPDLDERHARNALNQAVYRLRRTIGQDMLISRGAEELHLSPTGLWCDAVAFGQALRDDRLAAAMDLYRGPLLDGLHLGASSGFEHWLETERERLRLRVSRTAAALAEREETAGNPTGTARWLRRLLTLAPDDETALRRLMTVLDDVGDRTGALYAYDAFTRQLAYELDLSPSAETRALAKRIQSRRANPATLPDPDTPSVAVLPFANLSANPEQDYFCDGMTEEIIATLAQVPGLRVPARTSVAAYKNQPIDVRELARKLGVHTILEGSVRRADRQLRITAQLIGADGYHLWAEQYDRPLRDVFAIQEEIARSIAGALSVELLEKAGRRLTPQPTHDLEAHALYLKGLFHRHKRTPSDLAQACAYFEQAVDRDPGYAQAHAALAFTYAISGHFHYDVLAPADAYPLARSAASAAQSLDDQLPDLHTALGVLRAYYEWDWEGAERAFQRALTLDPDNPYALANYSVIGVRPGHIDKALALTHRCEALDPLWINAKVQRGVWLVVARRYAEAIQQLRQTMAMEPGFPVSPLYLGDAYAFLGRHEDAEVAYQRVYELVGRQPFVLSRLGALHAQCGRHDDAAQTLEELQALREERHVLPSYLADVYLTLGDHDQGLDWLERAYDERDTRLITLPVWPYYDPVHASPRFRRLLEHVGLAGT